MAARDERRLVRADGAEETILVREGSMRAGGPLAWKHILVIRDGSVIVLDMVPALLGWNLRGTTVQGETEWQGMDRAAIVSWLSARGDLRHPTEGEHAFAVSRTRNGGGL